MASEPHQTYLHGSRREGWWWGCITCDVKPPQWQYGVRADAQRDRQQHTADMRGDEGR